MAYGLRSRLCAHPTPGEAGLFGRFHSARKSIGGWNPESESAAGRTQQGRAEPPTRGREHPEQSRHRAGRTQSGADTGQGAPRVEQTPGGEHPEPERAPGGVHPKWSRLRAGCTRIGADPGRECSQRVANPGRGWAHPEQSGLWAGSILSPGDMGRGALGAQQLGAWSGRGPAGGKAEGLFGP